MAGVTRVGAVVEGRVGRQRRQLGQVRAQRVVDGEGRLRGARREVADEGTVDLQQVHR